MIRRTVHDSSPKRRIKHMICTGHTEIHAYMQPQPTQHYASFACSLLQGLTDMIGYPENISLTSRKAFYIYYINKCRWRSLYLCCVRIRQGVSVAVRAETDERDRHSQQAQEKGHHWRVLGYIISKIGHWLPDSHHLSYINLGCNKQKRNT